MNQDQLMAVLHTAHLSEKTSRAMAEGYYTFKVAKSANKKQIAKAVEVMFDVTVDQVRILNVKGKNKIFRQVRGRQSGWKKAYVKLQEGQTIDLGLGE